MVLQITLVEESQLSNLQLIHINFKTTCEVVLSVKAALWQQQKIISRNSNQKQILLNKQVASVILLEKPSTMQFCEQKIKSNRERNKKREECSSSGTNELPFLSVWLVLFKQKSRSTGRKYKSLGRELRDL